MMPEYIYTHTNSAANWNVVEVFFVYPPFSFFFQSTTTAKWKRCKRRNNIFCIVCLSVYLSVCLYNVKNTLLVFVLHFHFMFYVALVYSFVFFLFCFLLFVMFEHNREIFMWQLCCDLLPLKKFSFYWWTVFFLSFFASLFFRCSYFCFYIIFGGKGRWKKNEWILIFFSCIISFYA